MIHTIMMLESMEFPSPMARPCDQGSIDADLFERFLSASQLDGPYLDALLQRS
jgi:hypothetical protein